MENTFATEPTAEEAAQMQKVIQANLLDIEQLRERMQRDKAQIEVSGARTDAMLTQIQDQLAKLRAS